MIEEKEEVDGPTGNAGPGPGAEGVEDVCDPLEDPDMEIPRMMGARHHEKMDAIFRAMRDPGVADALGRVRGFGIPWSKVMMTLIGQIPNIMAGNWPAVIAALLGLINPPVPVA